MKKKTFLFLIISAVTFALLPIFNYYVDIARVFSNDYKKHYRDQLSNELYLQSQYMLEHPEAVKIIFGSSRIGNGLDLQKYEGWYKAWNQGANLVEHERTLKYLLSKNKRIEEVVVAIDYLSFFSVAKTNDYFRQNPPLTFSESLAFFNFYLYRLPVKKDLNAFFNNELVNNRKHIFSNVGSQYSREQRYFTNQNMFESTRKVNNANYQKNLASLKTIKELCENNNIKFSFFIQPFHYKNLLGQDPEFIKKYQSDLLTVADAYLNCSQLDQYKIDNAYWIDTSHYNTRLGSLILQDVIDKNTTTCLTLNKENIESYFKDEENALGNSLYTLLQFDMKIRLNNKYFQKNIYKETFKMKKLKRFSFQKKVSSNSDLLVEVNIQIPKPTQVRIQYNDKKYVSKAALFNYNGWPKVGNDHAISLLIDADSLNKNGFEIIADTNIQIKSINIFENE